MTSLSVHLLSLFAAVLAFTGFVPTWWSDAPCRQAKSDTLGIPYTVVIDDPALTLTNWSTYRDPWDRFTVAGQVRLAKEAEPLMDVITTLRLYGHDGQLLDVTAVPNVAFRLEPGRVTPFKGHTQIDPALVDHYTVSFEIIR